MRINKFLAEKGVASRRRVDEMIAAGRVKVNGEVCLQRGKKLVAGDVVSFEGNEIKIVG